MSSIEKSGQSVPAATQFYPGRDISSGKNYPYNAYNWLKGPTPDITIGSGIPGGRRVSCWVIKFHNRFAPAGFTEDKLTMTSGVTSSELPFNADMQCTPEVEAFFDEATNTISYIVKDPKSTHCAIIDSVLDIDYAAGRITQKGADRLIDAIQSAGWDLQWIIETHVHADHLSAAPYIQEKLGGKLGICENITVVQDTFGKIFNEGTEFQRDGSQFDQLFNDGDSYTIGEMTARVIHTPGHTPACTTHVIGNCAFVGDTLFMPDSGSGRADFPGGDARSLYRSMRRVMSLPEDMRVFMCHDYGTGGREIRWESTIGEQRRSNIHVHDGIGEEEFVKMREAADTGLSAPKLIIPALQVNMRAGEIPQDDSGRPMLKVPINGL